MANEQEVKKAIEEGKVESVTAPVTPETQETPDSPVNIQEFIIVLSLLQQIKRPLTAAPTTYVPKNFLEQLQFYANSLYAYIDNSWVGIGAKYARGAGSRGVAATGTQAITGLGFTPKLIRFKAITNSANGGWSDGHTSGVSNASDYQKSSVNAGKIEHSTGSAGNVVIEVSSEDYASGSQATISSFDADGFTLNWTSAGVATYFQWEAYG